jgi:hypothetical protein
MISKQKYAEWEKNIIQQLIPETKKINKSHSLVPSNTTPSIVFKNKIIVVVDYFYHNKPVSELLKTKKDCPKKRKIELYHLGKKTIDKVSYGLDKEGVFKFPATDFGGLTNYSLNIGETPKFCKTPSFITSDDLLHATVYNTWLRLSKKHKFYGNIKSGLSKFINSINTKAYIRFKRLPKERRILYTAEYIKRRFSKYYIRNFKGNDDTYAYEIDPKGLYCAITDNYITPNINKMNILNEYNL